MKNTPPTSAKLASRADRSAAVPSRNTSEDLSDPGNFQPAGDNPSPVAGRTYWRSLDELAETAEFRQWLEREFPQGASEFSDPVSRRHFVKIMSASFLLAGLGLGSSGCRRPVQKIEPFSKMPEDYVHGVAQYYATAMPTHGSAVPLVVKSNDGRPTKIEGNSLHPDSNGGTDRFAQASILNLYDPDRATRFTSQGQNAQPEASLDFLAQVSKKAQGNGGQGLCILLEPGNSPSRRRIQKLVADRFPQAQWFVHQPVELDIHRRAASQAFGRSVKPYYQFDKADLIVSLDCDFLGCEEDGHNHIRRFASRRHLENPKDSLNRLYVVESLFSLTGFNSDHRLRVPCSAVLLAARALAAVILPQGSEIAVSESLGQLSGAAPKWLSECAKDLLAYRGKSLIVAGHRQPLEVHILAYALNAALGNLGQTVLFHEAPQAAKQGDLAALAKALNSGQVETLLVLGSNPAYTAPADLDWAKTQRKARMVARLGFYEDETFPGCDWHFPAAHYLESWGDALTSDGTLVPIQPLIAPLFGGLTELEVLARIAGANVTDPYAIVRETFAGFITGGDIEAAWRKFLHDGFLANSAAKPVEVKLDEGAVGQALAAVKFSAPARDKLEVVFHRDYSVDDGRYNNNGWLQELPDPITKIVWDNAVLISRKTAGELGVKNSDVVEINLGNRSVRGPIWVQPGQADYSLGLALGYGRGRTGRVGQGAGFNVYPLRTADTSNFAGGATLRATGQTYPISCTQSHWSLEGRPIIREANLQQYREHPNFAKSMGKEELPVEKPLYPNPFDELKKKGLHQWGMSIDLNLCVGCSACMMACQSENNVPIVGKDQVKRGREMHWIRIDRYYAGQPLFPKGSPEAKQEFFETFKTEDQQQFETWIDNPQVVTQPMLCQHCESAPCENVCPVNATSHDQEGLNVMTYNRCVGTRYCSNNCPYKVRRFNFFDWNKRPIGQFYLGPLGHRKDDEWDLMKMSKNPDVTVRMRGVMEKCTFCLQRIEQAKIAQKTKAGASGDVVVPRDSFTTACAQACPAGAIIFGNLNEPESRVSKLKQLDRDYSVLEFLLTKPRTTYLARVRNPNPKMPDYYETPLSLQEYEQHNESPFEEKSPAGKPEGAAEIRNPKSE
ncbi:MAG TPA: TAT-variant-translocated molybdopterin oxidoreductase [Candidatus Binatia bacterium]|jgi:MoCo/4Fe-4S cofactor protein with predicted Tat translocation signal|nr:TAT-variant-translocated molybdopterin oxidoreductase [Candidatus Binatia bacterium]